MRHRGDGPPFARLGRRIVCSWRDIEAWLAAHTTSPARGEPWAPGAASSIVLDASPGSLPSWRVCGAS